MAKLPKILERLILQLTASGMKKDKAYAVAVSTLQKSGNLKKGTTEATMKGVERGNMTPAERAKDRAAKRSGGHPSEYHYNEKNNTAVKGRINGHVKGRK